MTGEATDLPAKFPASTIVEQDNSVVRRMRTTNIENAVEVMYQADTYSNRARGKKQEAEEIAAVIDEVFASLNFTRISGGPMPDLQDASIYRYVARYSAIVDRNLNIYQN